MEIYFSKNKISNRSNKDDIELENIIIFLEKCTSKGILRG